MWKLDNAFRCFYCTVRCELNSAHNIWKESKSTTAASNSKYRSVKKDPRIEQKNMHHVDRNDQDLRPELLCVLSKCAWLWKKKKKKKNEFIVREYNLNYIKKLSKTFQLFSFKFHGKWFRSWKELITAFRLSFV